MFVVKKLLVSALFLVIFGRVVLADGHHVAKRALLFPRYTILQFTYGVSAPAILPSRTINLSLAVQVNFDLPYNVSNFMPITYYARSSEEEDADIDRRTLYRYIVNVLDGMNLNGEDCLLRAICEVAHVPLHVEDENSLLEKIVHYVLTPSIDYGGPDPPPPLNATYGFEEELLEAERLGGAHGNCGGYYSDCAVSIVDLISAHYKV